MNVTCGMKCEYIFHPTKGVFQFLANEKGNVNEVMYFSKSQF